MTGPLFFNDEKIIVQIDSELMEIVPRFLENRHKDLEIIRQAIEQNNLTLIQMVGHKMKGSGSGYGFDFITDIGRRLEGAARRGNGQDIQTFLQALDLYLTRLEVVWLPTTQTLCA